LTAAEKKPARPRNATLETLSTTFAVIRDCLPLAIGIHKVIAERHPEIDQGHLRTAMRIHTASTRYLKALSQAQGRFDLDGNAVGEVTAEQRQQASDGLRERFKKGADRRRAELEAQELQKKEQERQQNLQKLAAKFNAR